MSSNEYKHQPTKGFATKSIHVAQEPEKWSHLAVVVPLVTSASYKQLGPGELLQYEYSRCGNPTRNALEECLAALENAKYGLTFATGLGALTAVTQLLQCGDHILAGDDMYGGTNRLLSKMAPRSGIETSFADFKDFDIIKKSLKTNTKLVWMETPTNPSLKVIDIEKVSSIVHKFNKDIIVVVDNTFLTPYFQLPLELGADMVMHSLSKYINGHCDVVMGAVITKREDLHTRLRYIQNASGIVPGPFDCSQVLRGIKTLKIRMQEHSKNALAIAKFLESHPFVVKVRHPGLPSHPDYELSMRQTGGHSGMVSFNLRGGLIQTKKFLNSLKIITLAGSLGATQSLVEVPQLMSHASISAEERQHLEITDSFIRLSVGLEDVEDLIADLDTALKASQK